jgi:molecular chaperone DnaK
MSTSLPGSLVGIDLGTTMSVIARLDPRGTAVTLPNSSGEPLTPSVIYLEGKTALVGKTAREAASIDSSRAAAFVKREMGSPSYSRTVDGRRFHPETLSGIILRKLKLDAERRIGPVARAVITVPAFFDDTRRKATEDAGRIAGLEVFDILNEPTAAALSYAMLAERRRDPGSQRLDIPGGAMTAVVYDLGGGTFDVTVVRLQSRRFETLATDGEVRLGGKDWDDRIVDLIGRKFREQFGVDPTADPARRDALGAVAEKTKVLLSSLSTVPIEFSYQGHTLQTTLTRAQFEEMTADLLMRTRVVTDLVVRKQAGLRWDQIDSLLLVGGSTRMPIVKAMLTELTGKPPDDSLDADQVVAQGAAIHSGILVAQGGEGALEIDEDVRRELQSVTALNVNSHSLGVEAMRANEPVNSVLIPKNTQLPFATNRVFRLRTPGATSVCVTVLEGEATEAASNIRVGECQISDLPPGLVRGSPIQVRLAYGANGRINVMALDMTHGRFAQTTIERSNRLTDDDIRREAEFVAGLLIQ